MNDEQFTVVRTEVLSPEPARSLADLLGTELPEDGTLPPLWHWLYHLDRPSLRDLGPDGHALRGVLPTPPGPGQRRMFAGGRATVHHPLRLGRSAVRRSVPLPAVVKEGRSGHLTFITVRTEIGQDGVLAVSEEQDVVYLSSARDPEPPAPPSPVSTKENALVSNEILLFRFSALTYNTHRIHYDRQYAQQIEGYPDLVVHGPLQAIYLAEQLGRPARLDFRFLTPMFVGQPLTVRPEAVPTGPDAPDQVAVIPTGEGKTAARMRAWRTDPTS